MTATVDSVKEIASFLADLSPRFKSEDHQALALRYADVLEDAAAELVRLKGLTTALPPDLGNIHDLPQEILDELSIATADEIEDQIVTVINAYSGTATLDQILVGLFRKFGVAQKRRFLQNKLYRMTMVWSVPGKKGVYTTEEPEPESEDDAASPTVGVGAASSPAYEEEDVPF